MKLLAFLFLSLLGLKLAIGEMPSIDVINASSTAVPNDEGCIPGTACDDVTSNGTRTNESETDGECGVCESKVLYWCENGTYTKVTRDESVAYQVLHVIVYIGFSLSLAACIIANVIYVITRRALRAKGSPYHIHWNLIATFTLYHVLFLISYSVLPSCYVSNVHVRNLLNVLVAYTVLANFFWMLVEGLILFGIVVISFFKDQRGRQFVKWCVLGWGAPAVLVTIWIVLEQLTLPENCKILQLKVDKPSIKGIACLVVPVFIILLVNGVVLIVVMINISRKLRTHDRHEDQKRHRRTAKSTFVLLILLGAYYALPILFALIENPCLMVISVTYVANIISSVQGLAVSTLYVFCNAEVRRILGKRFSDMNFSMMTTATRVNTPSSSSKRNSSSSGSEGRRRGTAPSAMEMSPMSPRPDVNSNKDDDRIIMDVGVAVAGSTNNQEVRKKTRDGPGYSKLETDDPDV